MIIMRLQPRATRKFAGRNRRGGGLVGFGCANPPFSTFSSLSIKVRKAFRRRVSPSPVPGHCLSIQLELDSRQFLFSSLVGCSSFPALMVSLR